MGCPLITAGIFPAQVLQEPLGFPTCMDPDRRRPVTDQNRFLEDVFEQRTILRGRWF